MASRKRKKPYKSKSYRAFVDRLYKKYPAVDMFAEAVHVERARPGFMRRLLAAPGTKWPTPPTPKTDGFLAEFRKYDRRQTYDHLCPIPELTDAVLQTLKEETAHV